MSGGRDTGQGGHSVGLERSEAVLGAAAAPARGTARVEKVSIGRARCSRALRPRLGPGHDGKRSEPWCQGVEVIDVQVVSRLMSSSVSRLSSLMGCVRMSRGVEGCRGLCRGVSRACRGSECQGVEGVCLWRPNIRLNNNTVCIRYSCCTYSFLQSYLTGCASSSPPPPSSYC